MFMPGLAPDALGLGVHQDFARAIETLDHRFVILTTSAGAMAVPEEIVSLPEARRWRGLASLWVANYYSARNPLRLSSLVILGVVASVVFRK